MRKTSWIIVLVALVVGAIGVYQRLAFGHEVAGYSSPIPWGLWIATYIFFIGLSAGAFLLSTLVYVFRIKEIESMGRLALLTALATLIAALVTIWLDLGQMGRFWRVFTNPNFHSAMTWMVWLYTAYFILLTAELFFAVRSDLVKNATPAMVESDKRMLSILGTIGIPLAIAFHGGVGTLFAVVQARPYWNTPLFPILFLVSALSSGSALLTFVAAVVGPGKQSQEFKRAINFLAKAVVGLLVLDLLFELAEFIVGTYGPAPAHALPYQLILFGQNWWIFWIVHLLLGALIPVILLTIKDASTQTIGSGALLITLGFLGVRYNIVLPGLLVPLFPALPAAYIEPKISYTYVPTLSEWLVVLFVLALGTTIFLFGIENLPILGRLNRSDLSAVGQVGSDAKLSSVKS